MHLSAMRGYNFFIFHSERRRSAIKSRNRGSTLFHSNLFCQSHFTVLVKEKNFTSECLLQGSFVYSPIFLKKYIFLFHSWHSSDTEALLWLYLMHYFFSNLAFLYIYILRHKDYFGNKIDFNQSKCIQSSKKKKTEKKKINFSKLSESPHTHTKTRKQIDTHILKINYMGKML